MSALMTLLASSASAQLVQCAAVLHFVQMPFMLVLAKRLKFRLAIAELPPIGREFVVTFAQGIVMCVTGLGVVVGLYPDDVVGTSLGRGLLCFLFGLSAFRVYRQTRGLGPLWPTSSRGLHFWLVGLHGAITTLYAAALYSQV